MIVSFSAAAVMLCCVIVFLCITFAPAKVSALSLSVSPSSLVLSSSKALNYSCSREDVVLSFEVYDESVATVENGIIYSHSIGTTSVRVTATSGEDRAIATAQITVTENPDGPIVDLPNEVTLYLIDKDVQQAKENGFDNEISFNSFRSYTTTITNNIVKVSKNTIVATKEGESTITFASTLNSSSYTVKVIVKSIPASIVGLPSQLELSPSQQMGVDFTLSPSYYSGDAEVEFATDSEILAIENNVITAASSGQATIKVLLNGEEVSQIAVSVQSPVRAQVTSVYNSEVNGSNILLTKNQEGCVILRLYNEQGKQINFSGIQITAEGVELNKQLNYFHIKSEYGGSITIYAPDLGCKIILNVLVK